MISVMPGSDLQGWCVSANIIIMHTVSILLTVILSVSVNITTIWAKNTINITSGEDKTNKTLNAGSLSGGVGKCDSNLIVEMGTIMRYVDSKRDTPDVQEKTCAAIRTFFNCTLKESFEKNPTEPELNKLAGEKALKYTGLKQAMENCNINLRDMADKIYKGIGAGVASPVPLLAATVTALGVFILSNSL